MLHKLRLAMGNRDRDYRLKDVIEFDGASFGNRDDDGKKSKVFLAVERRSPPGGKKKGLAGFAKHLCTTKWSRDAVKQFMDNHVAPTTAVKTDGDQQIEDEIATTTMRHDVMVTYGFKRRLDSHLPWVHRLIGNMKAKLKRVYHGVSPKYLDRYIAEYLYRFNRRWWREQLQTPVITACLACGPVSYADTTR